MATVVVEEHGELDSEISDKHHARAWGDGDGRSPQLVPSSGTQHAATHYYVSPLDELQPGLKDEDVQQIDEVAEVVHEQPAVDV